MTTTTPDLRAAYEAVFGPADWVNVPGWDARDERMHEPDEPEPVDERHEQRRVDARLERIWGPR